MATNVQNSQARQFSAVPKKVHPVFIKKDKEVKVKLEPVLEQQMQL